ncbi:vacuolar protein sorting-associated protein 16 homolog isoform X3 [Salvelinus namaycush]|uniref:Vacuolar protein sorting-associated protein 16 homolog n=1 Tax=Salvelinus namaycush TaxID=8040 RepID=A0A8U0R3A8_SALNM|nr:vacuolar protein sorting-associated protein 16 homolog isoform X3 [Salvelinus namaycush]XP_038854265.1 vacuolar protein sorting-associated protein 16 homolog isoform X3 [Salvelinus namaycush]
MAFITANWNPLGEAFYRKIELYEMGWSLRDGLKECLVAAAPYGGPIALLRQPQRPSSSARPQLEIYSSSGVNMASFPEVVQNQVLEAKVFHSPYGTGVAIVTGASRFTLATNIDDLKLRRLPEVPGLQGAPSCWAVLTQDRQTKVLLANGADLYILDNTSCTPVTPPGLSPQACSIVNMAVSFSYKYLALFTDSGHLWMGSANFKDKLSEVDTKVRTPPKQMVWCRRPKSQQPSVVIMWDRLLLVAGECTDTIQYTLDEESVCVAELDGVRIVGGSRHELLQEVPSACQDIFKIASMAPGALLLEAHKEYEKSSQKADEYLREIKEQSVLGEAVRQCVEAAGYEHEPETQKTLLRAASFGKCFLSNYPPEPFVSMCRDLKVLNSVRDYTVGIPLTHTQYKQMTVQVLIDRLVYRKLYPLAIEICRYLKTPEYQGVSRVLKHWACCKVQQKEEPDESIAHAVSVKLGEAAGISYSEIAARAYECGRTELAIKLLEFEPRSGEQVPLLLKMKRSQLALSKAIESGDTDLVYTVVTYLKNEMNRGDFFMTLRNQPVALSLYRQFCKHQEQDTLKDLFNQDDDHQELGNFYVKASYKEKKLEARLSLLQSAVDEYNKARNEFAAKATEEEMKLLRFQRRLDEEKGEALLGLSLQETLHALLTSNFHKQAEQLYRDFRVPDKRYWWLKLTALAEKDDWEEMEKFAKSKKSPIGYLVCCLYNLYTKPFVEVCVKQHNKYEAKKYVSKVTPEQKVKAHLAIGDLEGAAEAAIERRSEGEISTVLSRCSPTTDRALLERLNRARSTAAKK